MKYAMSDIHGCYDKFIKMLELIKFSSKDELYIIGDIFDRGSEPLKILDYILGSKNITLLKGNHELMWEHAYENHDYQLWYQNGGAITHSQIIQKDFMFEDNLYRYIKKLPLYKIVDNFILIHAGLYLPKGYEKLSLKTIMSLQGEENLLWDRSYIGFEREIEGYKIILGHTTTQMITDEYADVKMFHTNGTTYIDCGCVFEGGKLACLRLDDMKEFYI